MEIIHTTINAEDIIPVMAGRMIIAMAVMEMAVKKTGMVIMEMVITGMLMVMSMIAIIIPDTVIIIVMIMTIIIMGTGMITMGTIIREETGMGMIRAVIPVTITTGTVIMITTGAKEDIMIANTGIPPEETSVIGGMI
jgi:hypothetical protein